MKSIGKKFLGVLLLGALFFYSCSDDTTEESKNSITEATSEETESNLNIIREKLFALDAVSADEWALVLIGNHETVVGDICGDSEDCSVSTDHFELLREGENIFDLLDSKTQDLIAEANNFFAGDVTVYDEANTARDEFLNDIKPELGHHELALAKIAHIEPLHEAGYRKNFWPDAKGEDKIEAFSDSYDSDYSLYTFSAKDKPEEQCSGGQYDENYRGSQITYTYYSEITDETLCNTINTSQAQEDTIKGLQSFQSAYWLNEKGCIWVEDDDQNSCSYLDFNNSNNYKGYICSKLLSDIEIEDEAETVAEKAKEAYDKTDNNPEEAYKKAYGDAYGDAEIDSIIITDESMKELIMEESIWQ